MLLSALLDHLVSLGQLQARHEPKSDKTAKTSQALSPPASPSKRTREAVAGLQLSGTSVNPQSPKPTLQQQAQKDQIRQIAKKFGSHFSDSWANVKCVFKHRPQCVYTHARCFAM